MMLTTRASAAGLPALNSPRSRSEDVGKDPFLSSPHWRCRALRSNRMVVSEHVQCPVNHEPQQLLTGGNTLAPGIRAGDFGTNVDVTDHGAALSDSRESEGDDIRRSVVAEVAPIEARDGGASD